VGFREVSVVEVREVLRGWLEEAGRRKVAERAGVDRKTARHYVAAVEVEGLVREAGVEALSDELIGAVVAAVRPARPNGHGGGVGAAARTRGADPWLGRRRRWSAAAPRFVKIEERLAARSDNNSRSGRAPTCIGGAPPTPTAAT